MGQLLLKDKLCFIIIWALTVSYITTEREYFYQSDARTWDEARNHCQVCFKDLVTLTPEIIQKITKNVSSESWVGLRKNFYSNISFTSDNSTGDNSTCDNSTSDSTTIVVMPWSRWANGDPLSFQNWYPGWPVLNSSLPKRYCCSCSCTCSQPTTPHPTTQQPSTQSTPTHRMTDATHFTDFTTQDVTSFSGVRENATESVTDMSSLTSIRTDQQPDFSNVTVDPTEMMTNTSSSTDPVTAQSVTEVTSPLPTQAECVRSPMQMPYVPENYIEDSCVAMLSFGAWIEKECSELLPFICYEDLFFRKADVAKVTSSSAVLSWWRRPGEIDNYIVDINGREVTVESMKETFDLENLTAGNHYLVKVFTVKCGRALDPQEVDFYTIPNKVLDLKVANETETSISLIWTKPDGKVDFYETRLEDRRIKSFTQGAVVGELKPGNLYTFTVVSVVGNGSEQSEESRFSAYTRPGKVSDLKASENTNISLVLTWRKPEGHITSFLVTAVNSDNNISLYNETHTREMIQVKPLPTGSRITLSVSAVINHTVVGDKVTIHSYTNSSPISNLTLESGQDNIAASWRPPNCTNSSFTVTLRLNGTDIVTKHNLTEPEEKFQGLRSGTRYTVIVWTVSGHLKSSPVESSKFTLPMSPTDLRVTAFGKNFITLVWKAPANSLTSNFSVEISSSFWDTNSVYPVNTTSFKFEGLKSGTNYSLKVRTVADQELSSAANLTRLTEPETREISLSMLCTSSVSLLCDGDDSRERVVEELKEEMEKKFGDMIFWKFER